MSQTVFRRSSAWLCALLMGASNRSALSPEVSRKFPWELGSITNTESTFAFIQDAVEIAHYPKEIQKTIDRTFTLSGDGWGTSNEVGFFVVGLKDGTFRISKFTTSNSPFYIEDADSHVVLFELLSSAEPDQVALTQFFHTHPRGTMARTLSRADIDSAVNLQTLLRGRGINANFEIIAMPYEYSVEGKIIQDFPNEIGSSYVPPRKVHSFPKVILRATIPPR